MQKGKRGHGVHIMLRRHQCTIDLHNQVLVIGGERAAFLAEKDISLIYKEGVKEGQKEEKGEKERTWSSY